MSGKYAQNIVSGVKTVRSLPYHKPDKFFYPILMSGKRVPGAKMWCYYFFLHPNKNLAENPTISWAERHRHPEGSNETYFIIGDKESVVVEVTLGDNDEMETYQVASPGAVFIPAGITHSIKPVAMKPGTSGGIMAVVTSGEYICLPPK
jgi:hypothetical protein